MHAKARESFLLEAPNLVPKLVTRIVLNDRIRSELAKAQLEKLEFNDFHRVGDGPSHNVGATEGLATRVSKTEKYSFTLD
jgi:hypothetical protein